MSSSQDEEYSHLCKIVLVGDTGVGKTHLLNRYVRGNIPKTIIPTIGVEFATKTVSLKNGEKMKAQIWDTAGQERYRSITNAHYRRALGALLVYDITNEKSYINAKKWMDDLKSQADQNLVIILVGNKIDLVGKDDFVREVDKEKAKYFANENNLLFQETSALTQNNVTEVFETLLEEINSVMNKRDDNKTGSDRKNNILIGNKRIEQEQGCKFC